MYGSVWVTAPALELGVAIVALTICISCHTCLVLKLMSLLTRQHGTSLLKRAFGVALSVPIVLIASCISFPIINMCFPPHHLALLYVVGDRLQPHFCDGDIMATVSVLEPLVPGDVVLHRNHTNGGLLFDGVKTPIRLRKVLEVGRSVQSARVQNVTLQSTSDHNGVATGDQVVMRRDVLAKAVIRIPGFAIPLRWLQQGIHRVHKLPLPSAMATTVVDVGLAMMRAPWIWPFLTDEAKWESSASPDEEDTNTASLVI